MFGSVDPFCFLAVFPLLLVAAIVTVMGSIAAGLICVVLAGLVLPFDSWANRPDPPPPVRRRPPPASAPARRPMSRAQPPRPASRRLRGGAAAPSRGPVLRDRGSGG